MWTHSRESALSRITLLGSRKGMFANWRFLSNAAEPKTPSSHTCCGIYLESLNEWESVAYKNSVGRLGLNRQINHIYIMLCYLELRFMHDFLPDFSQFLEHNYETLTCIELLSPESKYSRPVIYQILDECQNLMTLQLPNSSYHGEATIRISRKLKIKYLTWSLSNTFSCKDLMIVLKHCPDLQILELCDNYTLSAEISRTLTQVFFQIGDICPSLRQVLFTGCVSHNGAPMSTWKDVKVGSHHLSAIRNQQITPIVQHLIQRLDTLNLYLSEEEEFDWISEMYDILRLPNL